MADIIAHPGRRFRLPLRDVGRRLLSRVGCDCPLCGGRVAGARLCGGCQADIMAPPPGAVARCPRCALRPAGGVVHCTACMAQARAFSRTVAAFDYAPPADTLILMLKTRLRLSMAPVLARLMAEALRAEAAGLAETAGLAEAAGFAQAAGVAQAVGVAAVGSAAVSAGASGGSVARGVVSAASAPATSLPPGVLLVPIPASRASLRLRGMNPAAEIACSLAAELGLPRPRHALARRRETPRQATLGRRARQQGAVGLFVCVQPVRGHHVAVVDDVMTTGSTANAAAAALLAAGAASVTVLVAARTP